MIAATNCGCDKSTQLEIMNDEILNDAELAERWKIEGTPEAIAKKLYRLRALPKSNPRHLKSFPVGNQKRYRLRDIIEYEARAKSSLLSLLAYTNNDTDELDPTAGIVENLNYP